MIRSRTLMLLCLVAALGVATPPAFAQYMYLDANGNGVYDSGDHLAPNGTPTTVDLWLVTDHNRDGSPATCDVDPAQPLPVNDYYFSLLAGGGLVSYSGFTTHLGTIPFGELNPGDGRYANGYGGVYVYPPGTYHLATLTITATSGAPQVSIVDRVNGAIQVTDFGMGSSACFGNDFDNTYKLTGPAGGSDWTDVDGLGPASNEATPVLNAIGNKTVNEGACLNFTATATAANGGALIFTLDAGAPSGASITTDGQFTWCPTEAQGPGVYPITVRVTENVSPFASDAETFQVTVNEVNQAPLLAAISNKTIMAGNTLTFTATATDADLPANALTFSLDPGAPAGATITAGGLFSWPVPVNQVQGVTITVRVTDNGTPALSDAKSFFVTVLIHETGPPVITNPGNKTVSEGSCLDFTIIATSSGGGTLTFSLGAGAPAGASITAGGQFHWCPTEAQGPGVYTIIVNCSDGTSVASIAFSITVLEVNVAPVLAPIGNKTGCAGIPITFTATSTDIDLPANTLTYSLDPGSYPGATIDPVTGAFSVTFSGGTLPFTIRVTDNGSPPLSDSETIVVTALLSPPVPVLDQPTNMTVMAGLTADQALHASDLCGNPLTFSKVSGPAFVTVTTLDATTGNVHLAPTASDVGSFSVTVQAANWINADQKTFTVTVSPNDALPVLQPIANMTVDEGATQTQTIVASEPDNAPLSFVKVSGPFWVLVQTTSPTTGLITASPDFSAGGGVYPVTVQATNGTLYDQRSFTVTVNSVCRLPLANAGGPYSGQIAFPVDFDGTSSSDPDGNLTSFTWDFGDGTSGSGATASHTYVATGTYTVVLTVQNGCGLTDSDQTTATISECHSTQAFVLGGNKQINLQSGKPTWCAELEVSGLDATDVDLSSIVLHSTGTGSVGEIHALSDKTSVGGDRNGNGLPEITACFRKDDLRQLFSNVTGTQQVGVTFTGDLQGGGSICAASLTITVKGGGGVVAASISPNPLNPSAVLTFSTSKPGAVKVQIFDTRGRLVRTLMDQPSAAAGYHDVSIDGRDAGGNRLASGVYYVQIQSVDGKEAKAITILK